MDAIVVTFKLSCGRVNIWIWPQGEEKPKVEVNVAESGSDWLPHPGPIEVEIQGALPV